MQLVLQAEETGMKSGKHSVIQLLPIAALPWQAECCVSMTLIPDITGCEKPGTFSCHLLLNRYSASLPSLC